MEILAGEQVIEDLKKGFGFDFSDPMSDSKTFSRREDFRKGVSWHVPTEELVDLILKYGPLVSVGSGFAYTESLVKQRGGDIIPTDIEPTENNPWCRDGDFYCEVEKLKSGDAVKKYNDRNVFMAWPPYDTSMAYEAAKEIELGRYLIYVGEGYGGCTGDDQFFNELRDKFEKVEDISIPQWCGIHDYCQVYKKIK